MRNYIFDFNGTLFLDSWIHRIVWKRFLADRGHPITDAEFDKYVYGPGNDVIFRHFFGDSLTPEQVNALSEEKEAAYREFVLNDPKLKTLTPGAVEMLDMLKARNIPCAVATASIRSNVDFYMNELGLRRWFNDDHVFYMTGDIPGKPDPTLYLRTMERLGYVPRETTVVEDSLSGIRAAEAAGVGRIIAIDTTMGPEALSKVEAVDVAVHDFYGCERFLND